MENKTILQHQSIVETIQLLERRIGERFPEGSLRKICGDFHKVAKEAERKITWIGKPLLALRIVTAAVILLALAGIAYAFTVVEFKVGTNLENIAAVTESVINDLVLLGAAIFFLVTFERRIKRNRAIEALNELRTIAHVIDMHQLTKDPIRLTKKSGRTKSSPQRSMTRFELGRYLDYCSEMLSLIGKVAALYSQGLPDDVVVRTVNEIETLSSGMNRKIWQKLIILNDMEEEPGMELPSSIQP